jgi:hypothetical protein
MRGVRFLPLAAGIVLLGVFPVLAHHSLASEYRTNQTVTLKGTVTRVEWSNPHARLYLDTHSESGEVMKWDFELASPNLLTLHGWKIDTVRSGDRVTVDAYPARDGSNRAYATKISRGTP